MGNDANRSHLITLIRAVLHSVAGPSNEPDQSNRPQPQDPPQDHPTKEKGQG